MSNKSEKMVETAQEVIVNVPLDLSKLNLAWSLQPILWSLRAFGIDFDVNQPRSTHRRSIFILSGAVIILIFGYFAYDLIHFSSHLLHYRTSTEPVYMATYLSSLAIINSLSITALLAVANFKWKTLWTKLKDVEQLARFTDDSYKKMRKTIATSIVVVILLVGISFDSLQVKFQIIRIFLCRFFLKLGHCIH